MKKKKDMKFNSLLKGLIMENARYEFLVNTFTKPKEKDGEKVPPIMKLDTLMSLIQADPQSRVEGDNVKKVGPYTQWVIKQYLKLFPKDGEEFDKNQLKRKLDLFFEDLYKTTTNLQKFDRFKNRLSEKDINKYSIETLDDAVYEFSLDKTKATKDEKKEASKTFTFPGSTVEFNGPNWVVTKVEDKGPLGKDAACFFGGYNEETSWCTSAPGLNWFEKYIKDGPLYQVFNKNSEPTDKTGLPGERYQFHFQSGQYMDKRDRQIDLVKFLNTEAPELKDYFKPQFMKNLSGPKGDKVTVNYPNDSSSNFIALYGFDEFFQLLPENLKRLEFSVSSRGGNTDLGSSLEIPEKIGDFKDLEAIHLENIVGKLPESIGKLKNLIFLSLPNNKSLKSIPKSIANLENLAVINLGGSNPNIEIPKEIIDKAEDPASGLHLFKN